MSHVLKRRTLEQDVYTLALERIRHCYTLFDRIAVAFSGGKDSTVVLNCALTVARELGRLPLDAYFWDEEAIPPETVEYVARVAACPDVRLRWLCLPVTHRNGCSRQQPYWHPWHPEQQHLWCRPLPDLPQVETSLPGFHFHAIPDADPLLFAPQDGTVGVLCGMRAQESIRRLQSVCHKTTDNYIAWREAGYIALVKPIYDWRTEDVWLAPHREGWDYNRAYDLMDALGIPRSQQRCAPPFGEEPMQRLNTYQRVWPELWDTMCARVPGARTAARYARTELYGFGNADAIPGRTWREMVSVYLRRHGHASRPIVANRLRELKLRHANKTRDPIPEDEPHPETGVSWKWLAKIAQRGDFKRRKNPSLNKRKKKETDADTEPIGTDALADRAFDGNG